MVKACLKYNSPVFLWATFFATKHYLFFRFFF